MPRVRMSDERQSYWLSLCVLLLYQHTAETAILLNGTGKQTVPQNGVTDTTTRQPPPQDLNAIQTQTQKNPVEPQCSDWEIFDGVDCVCADESSVRCTNKGGMVCDKTGKQYQSACAYAHGTCRGKVPPERSIETCGFCCHLQLVAGHDSRVVAVFSRTSNTTNNSVEYQSNNGVLVFYSPELGVWAVGRRTDAGTFIAMREVKNSTYPQDEKSGMLVATQQGGQVIWELDPFMHFQCAHSSTVSHRHRRFVFVAFVFVGLAATATATTLKVVQAKKGCLYYPAVCRLRDRIRDHLKPEVTRLRDRFISTYGDPGKFKQRVDTIHDQTLDIRDKLIAVKELHSKLRLQLSDITVLSSSIQDDFPEFKHALTNYNGWAKNLKQMAAINILMFELEVAMTLPSLVATSVGSFALAAAEIGALVAVGFAVVDVVSSVKEEKKVRDELRDTESKYLKAKSELESAFSNIKQFQRKFCTSVIAFYRDISGKGKTYDKTFQSLHSYIRNLYGNAVSDCTGRYTRSKLGSLTRLSNQYLQPLIKFLGKDIDNLRRKIAEVKETNMFLSEITNMVKSDKKSPAVIFRAIKASKPKAMSKTFTALWDVLSFIAKQVLPTTSCYWGYYLGDIRGGAMTKSNYYQYPVCSSPEINNDVLKIQNGIKTGFAPCKIFRQVQGTIFRSKYSVVKYIADNIIKSSSCYWSYDLNDIRKQNSNAKEINTALINSGLFQILSYFRVSAISERQISSARDILCTAHQVCSTAWQNFILCKTWRGHGATKSLGCDGKTDTDTAFVCVPGALSLETCT